MTATDLTAFDAEEQRLMTLTERRSQLAAREAELRAGIRRGMFPAAELALIDKELIEVDSEIADMEFVPGLMSDYPALRWAGDDPHMTHECSVCEVLLLARQHRKEKGNSPRADGSGEGGDGLPAVAMFRPDPVMGGSERPICSPCLDKRAKRRGKVGQYAMG